MTKPPAALSARFLERVALDLAFLREGHAGGPRFELVIHRLAGMSGMYGFDELSRLAGVVDGQVLNGAVSRDDLATLIAAMEAVVRRG